MINPFEDFAKLHDEDICLLSIAHAICKIEKELNQSSLQDISFRNS